MNEIYRMIAEGHEKLAAAYKALAGDSKDTHVIEEAPIAKPPKENNIGIEAVRAVLAEKSRDGKTHEVKALLMKYDAGKLSGVKPEDYAALLAEAEAL